MVRSNQDGDFRSESPRHSRNTCLSLVLCFLQEQYHEGLEQAVANWAKQAHYPPRAVRVSRRTMENGIAGCALSAKP